MDVLFTVKSERDQIKVIQSFLSRESGFSKKVFNYFGIDISEFKKLSEQQKSEFIHKIVSAKYKEKLPDMQNAVPKFQKHWDKNKDFVNAEFQKIFGVSHPDKVCRAEVNINPVFPRYLDTWSFDIHSDVPLEKCLEVCLHEITHFLWFDKWKEVFPNWKKQDLERPSISWLFLEISVDPIFKNSAFKSITPEQPAYDYFYKETVNNENMMEFFRKLYKENSLEDYMKKGLCQLQNKNKVEELCR